MPSKYVNEETLSETLSYTTPYFIFISIVFQALFSVTCCISGMVLFVYLFICLFIPNKCLAYPSCKHQLTIRPRKKRFVSQTRAHKYVNQLCRIALHTEPNFYSFFLQIVSDKNWKKMGQKHYKKRIPAFTLLIF